MEKQTKIPYCEQPEQANPAAEAHRGRRGGDGICAQMPAHADGVWPQVNGDLTGFVIVLRPETNLAEYRRPQDLLFYVWGGYGARDTLTISLSLFGTYLDDGCNAKLALPAFQRLATAEDLECLPTRRYLDEALADDLDRHGSKA